MRSWVRFLWVGAIASAVWACGTGEEEAWSARSAAIQAPYATVEGSCEDPLAPTWENFGAGFVRNYCRGCHGPELEANKRTGAPIGIDFATHAHVLDRLERFEARAASEQPTMPPGGGPGPVELELLRRWIRCGAP